MRALNFAYLENGGKGISCDNNAMIVNWRNIAITLNMAGKGF
jgi:hypothetical protein